MFRQLATTGFLAVFAFQAQAENCAKRQQVVERLQSEYAEELTAGGLQGQQDSAAVVEVWASPATGTFTVMLTDARGVSCIMATGTDWFSQQPLGLVPDTAS